MNALTLLLMAPMAAAQPAGAAAPPPPAPASVELPAPLARVLTDYESAWQKKDAVALAAIELQRRAGEGQPEPPLGRRPETA